MLFLSDNVVVVDDDDDDDSNTDCSENIINNNINDNNNRSHLRLQGHAVSLYGCPKQNFAQGGWAPPYPSNFPLPPRWCELHSVDALVLR